MTAAYDVFFCYSWKDKAAADQLAEALRAHHAGGRPLRVFQDDRELADYDLITPEVNAKLASSRCLVAFYSENLLGSAYCRFELQYALSAAHRLDGTPQRVMAVLRNVGYEDVRPAQLAALRLPDPRTATTERLVASIGARVAATDDRALGEAGDPPGPRWYPTPLAGTHAFHGRDLELWEVHDALHSHQDPGVRGAAVARIVGAGGQGKTMLAEQYARLFAADYPGGVFVLRGFGSHLAGRAPASHHVQARHAEILADFAHRLKLDAGELGRAATAAAIRDHLDAQALDYLWIVDDLPAGLSRDTFTSLLAPTRGGHTLVTTRYRPSGYPDVWGTEVPLGDLDQGAALALLTSRRPPTDRAERAAALALAGQLGHYPLALAVAAALLNRPDVGGFAGLAAAVAAPGPDVLELAAQLWGDLPSGHGASVAATMLRSVQHLGHAGRDLLQAASLLAAAPIPRALLVSVLARAGEISDAAAGSQAEAGFAEAAALSLIDGLPTGDGPLWTVHTMVSRTLRHADPGGARRARLQAGAVDALAVALRRPPGGFATPALASFLPHADAVAAALAGEDKWDLGNEAAGVHAELGDSRGALVRYQRLHEACLATLGPAHETTLTVLAGLGVAYGLQGAHETALDCKLRACEGLAALLGPADRAVLTARNNVAVSQQDLGRLDLARSIYRDVYQICRRRFGRQDPDTLRALSNYAIATGACGNHRLALQLKRLAHQRSAAAFGPEHPVTLDYLNNVAASTAALGRQQEAHELLVQVRDGRQRALGDGHADTLTAAENVAGTADQPAAAVPGLVMVYRGRLTLLGPEHPETVRALRTLLRRSLPVTTVARAWAQAGSDDPDSPAEFAALLAIPFQEQCVERYGPDDPRTLMASCYLAHGLALQGAGTGAAEVIADAEAGLTGELGRRDPATAAARVLRQWIEDIG